ncbi:uncharacterized protein LOC134817997 isoform X1 [Bolinopsis microptera]|uniref:uncharacterized protein LOC134817997 isoform X1 n=1 Tax=Bolinopsis microptera TaxID=2820187 RepID=UPI00307ABA64
MGADQSKTGGGDIVVVNKDPSCNDKSKEPIKRTVTKLQPLLQHSASFGILASDHAALRQLNPRHLIELFTVYEEHLRQSSVVVSEEQNQLSRSIKQADQSVALILAITEKKHNVYNVWSNNIQSSVKEINQQLAHINTLVDGLVPLVNELNETLPVDERLPTFTQSDNIS